jgi:hypothetical protein
MIDAITRITVDKAREQGLLPSTTGDVKRRLAAEEIGGDR